MKYIVVHPDATIDRFPTEHQAIDHARTLAKARPDLTYQVFALVATVKVDVTVDRSEAPAPPGPIARIGPDVPGALPDFPFIRRLIFTRDGSAGGADHV